MVKIQARTLLPGNPGLFPGPQICPLSCLSGSREAIRECKENSQAKVKVPGDRLLGPGTFLLLFVSVTSELTPLNTSKLRREAGLRPLLPVLRKGQSSISSPAGRSPPGSKTQTPRAAMSLLMCLLSFSEQQTLFSSIWHLLLCPSVTQTKAGVWGGWAACQVPLSMAALRPHPTSQDPSTVAGK